MKITVLMGSPREHGNTAAALDVLLEQLNGMGAKYTFFDLYSLNLRPCLGCKHCQDETGFGCIQEDDLEQIYENIVNSDLLLLASPIYCWFCTAPMKTAIDRLIYATNKFYGSSGQRSSLLKGKAVAAVATCGYPAEKGSDLWEEGLRRWCKHGKMKYRGMLSLRDTGGNVPFMTEEYIERIKQFAQNQYRMAAEHKGD